MPLMLPKKGGAIETIMGKLSSSSTSENSTDELKKKNEQTMEQMSLDSKDDITSDSAVEAASQSLMTAFESKNTKAIASAIRDLFNLYELEDDKSEPV